MLCGWDSSHGLCQSSCPRAGLTTACFLRPSHETVDRLAAWGSPQPASPYESPSSAVLHQEEQVRGHVWKSGSHHSLGQVRSSLKICFFIYEMGVIAVPVPLGVLWRWNKVMGMQTSNTLPGTGQALRFRFIGLYFSQMCLKMTDENYWEPTMHQTQRLMLPLKFMVLWNLPLRLIILILQVKEQRLKDVRKPL